LTTPIYKHGNLHGYKHRKNLHKFNNNWVYDLVDKRSVKHLQKMDDKLILRRKALYSEAFTRDCCIVLKNIFFANKSGIEFDKKALKILKNVQPKRNIDSYAIFGYCKNGSAYGRTGSYLHFADTDGQEFIKWLNGKASKIKVKGGSQNASTHTLC